MLHWSFLWDERRLAADSSDLPGIIGAILAAAAGVWLLKRKDIE
jgi:LPXTG-motif cell wall-anchored protein